MTLNRIYFVCLRSLPTLCTLRKPLLTHTINTVTGHGTFRSHLSKLKMYHEPSCPMCCASQDTNIHFVFQYPRYNHLRKFQPTQTNRLVNTPKAKTKYCITISELTDYLRLSYQADLMIIRCYIKLAFRGLEYYGH